MNIQLAEIIIPIITAFSIMLKRNLIYTGITRAKKGDLGRSQTRAGAGDPNECDRKTQYTAWQKNYRTDK